jgi:hypothetical protein
MKISESFPHPVSKTLWKCLKMLEVFHVCLHVIQALLCIITAEVGTAGQLLLEIPIIHTLSEMINSVYGKVNFCNHM